jgi:hypothetical protein
MSSDSIPLRPPMTRDAAGTLLGQTMGLVAVTAGLFAVGAYLGRNLASPWGWLWFIAAFACLIAMNVAAQRSQGLTVTLLFGFGVLMGLAVAPTLSYYASADPQAVWQAGAATALFIAGFGAAGYATRPAATPAPVDSRLGVDQLDHEGIVLRVGFGDVLARSGPRQVGVGEDRQPANLPDRRRLVRPDLRSRGATVSFAVVDRTSSAHAKRVDDTHARAVRLERRLLALDNQEPTGVVHYLSQLGDRGEVEQVGQRDRLVTVFHVPLENLARRGPRQLRDDAVRVGVELH